MQGWAISNHIVGHDNAICFFHSGGIMIYPSVKVFTTQIVSFGVGVQWEIKEPRVVILYSRRVVSLILILISCDLSCAQNEWSEIDSLPLCAGRNLVNNSSWNEESVKELELQPWASHARTWAPTAKIFADLVDRSNLRQGMPLPPILLSVGSGRSSFVLMLSLLYPAYMPLCG